ncbi:MAG: hypothetical protein WKG00_18790 [Polyangiaceae bacterium]
MASAVAKPVELLATPKFVYWSERSREVKRVPRAGGYASLVDEQHDVHALTADGAGVYWLMLRGVRRLSSGESVPTTVFANEKVTMQGLVSDGSAIFWGAYGGSGFVLGNDNRGDRQWWVTGERDPPVVVGVEGADLYVQSWPSLDLVRVPKRGGKRTIVWHAVPEGGLAIGGGAAWTTHLADGTISRRPLSAGAVSKVVARGLDGVRSPLLSGGFVYWRDNRGVARLSTRSDRVQRVVDEAGVLAFSIEGSEVFWGTETEIFAAALPAR